MEEHKLKRKKQKALKEGKLDQFAMLCNKLGDYYTNVEALEDALEEFKEEAEVYMTLKMEMEKGRAHRMVGETFMLMANYEEALKHENIYLDIAVREGNFVEEQRAYATIGRVHLLEGQSETESKSAATTQFRKAEKSFIKSLLVCQKLDGDVSKLEIENMKSRLYLNLGITKENLGEFNAAIDYFNKAIIISKKNDLYSLIYNCYYSFGLFYQHKMNEYSKALRCFNEALDCADRLDDSVNKICEILYLKSEIFVKMGDFHSAKKALHQAYKKKTSDGNMRADIEKNLRTVVGICKAEDELITLGSSDYEKKKLLYEKLGDGCCNLHNYTKGIEFYKKMLKAAELNNEFGKQLIPIYVSLYQTYKDDGQNELALKYLWKEHDLNIELNNDSEACETLLNIASVMESDNRETKEICKIYERAKVLCSKDNRSGSSCYNYIKKVLKKQFQFYKTKQVSSNELEVLIASAEMYGISEDMLNEVDETDSQSAFIETIEDTPELGLEISLEELSDSDEEKSVKPTTSNHSLRKRNAVAFKVKRNMKGETQLHQACIAGNEELAKRLLDQGHPVNERDNAGWTPLHEACNHGFKSIVLLLLERGALINDSGGLKCDGITPLHDACANGVLEIIEILLDKGANVTLRTNEGETALEMIENWRSRARLNEEEESYYESVHNRMKNMLDKVAGLSGKKIQRKQLNRIIDQDLENSSDNDNLSIRRKSSRSSRSDRVQPTKSDATAEYQNVMSFIRSGNKMNQSESTEVSPSPIKSSKRTAFMDTEDIDDDWLENDMEPAKKRQKFYSDNVNDAFKRSPKRSSNSSGKKKPLQIVDSDSSSNDRSESPIQNQVKSVNNFTRKLSFGRIETNQQSSLMDAGFTRILSDKNKKSNNNRNSFGRVSNESPIKSNELVEGESVSYNTLSQSNNSVKVKVDDKILLIPISASNLANKNVQWLAKEASQRYYKLNGKRPILRLMTMDGAILENTDPLEIVKGEKHIKSEILEWTIPTIVECYKTACSDIDADPMITAVLNQMEFADITNKLDLSNLQLRVNNIKPIFKALQYQSKLTSISLSNNNLDDDGLKLFSRSLNEILHLTTLNLSGNVITAVGLECLLSALETKSMKMENLLELNLNFNPLGDRSLTILSKIICKLNNIKHLHLCSTLLTNLTNFDIQYGQLETLDLSYNTIDINSLQDVCVKLDPTVIGNLNLGFTSSSRLGPILQVTLFGGHKCDKLKTLNLTNCGIVDEEIDSICKVAEKLETLKISQNSDLTTLSLSSIFDKLHNLKNLYVEACFDILNTPSIIYQSKAKCLELIRISCKIRNQNPIDDSILIDLLEVLWPHRGQLKYRGGTCVELKKGTE